jgi:hypothetical protein
MHLSITSHPVAMTVERSVVRMAHNVLAEGIEAMQGVMRGKGRKFLAL